MSNLIESSQEQAVAAWVNLVNQRRIDTLLASVTQQGKNLGNSLQHLDEAMAKINKEIIERNLGGLKGMHGFIAEVAEVGVSNARATIHGKEALTSWVNDNGPVDVLRAGQEIQQKFVASGGSFSLQAVLQHLEKYPDFLETGGKYQIPADHFASLKRLHAMSQEEAARVLTKSVDGPSYAQWKKVQSLFSTSRLSFDSIEPSKLDYSEVQRGRIAQTLDAEANRLKETDETIRDQALQESLPRVGEALKVTAAAAAIEGTTTFVLAVIEKRRHGKKLKDFTEQDWQEIFGESAGGTLHGGVRGISLYLLTNFTATSAAVGSAIVTSSYGVAEQAHKLRTGEINELEFIENAEFLALQSAVSALSSLIGQATIPIPIIGAILGNAVGMIMYRCAKGTLSKREEKLIEQYLESQQLLDEKLAREYQSLLDQLDAGFSKYLSLIERAFVPDPELALLGSVKLALELGVPTEDILDSEDKISAFFMA